MTISELPPGVRNGGRSADRHLHFGDAGEDRQDPLTSVRDEEQRSSPPHSSRYVVERGSGGSGTAYNHHDHEVIDLGGPYRRRVMARATCLDAELICRALNAFGGS